MQDVLIEALMFYANIKNYKVKLIDKCHIESPVQQDRGDIARDALESAGIEVKP